MQFLLRPHPRISIAKGIIMAQTALVLGASGGFGGQVASALKSAGWTVRRYRRGTDMAAAAKGADLIVNGLNPPAYHDWDRLIPEITISVLAAGKASGATLLVPGNVYPYGTEPGPWNAETPHRPTSRKGHIRAEMEARYRDASAHGQRTSCCEAATSCYPKPLRC